MALARPQRQLRTRSAHAARLLIPFLCFFLCAGLGVGGSTAASADNAAPFSREAVAAQLQSLRVVQGRFEQQRQLAGMRHTLHSSGVFLFWRDHGLYLETREPFFSASTITSDQLIQWDADGTHTSNREHSGIVQREINRTLLALFSADLARIEERFDAEWQHTDSQWQLRLTPAHPALKRHIEQVTLHGAGFVESLVLEASEGDITRLRFLGTTQAEHPGPAQCARFLPADTATCTATARP